MGREGEGEWEREGEGSGEGRERGEGRGKERGNGRGGETPIFHLDCHMHKHPWCH